MTPHRLECIMTLASQLTVVDLGAQPVCLTFLLNVFFMRVL